jgi:hypothetical protein
LPVARYYDRSEDRSGGAEHVDGDGREHSSPKRAYQAPDSEPRCTRQSHRPSCSTRAPVRR